MVVEVEPACRCGGGGSHDRPAWARRYTAFITRHEIAWELTFGVLAVLFVIVGFLADESTGDERNALEGIDLVLTGVFAVEFLSRFTTAASRRRYLRGHWTDLIALVPTVRGLRVARLLRLLRLVRAFAGLYRALSRFERLARHGGLVWMFSAWLAIMVLCSLALYAAENGVNKAITSPYDALWWGIVTLTTVGYGDVYPVTPEGRLAAMVLMIGGISLFAGMTATVTSFMVGQHSAPDDPTTRLRALADLRNDGIVSEEEYEIKKAELLRRL